MKNLVTTLLFAAIKGIRHRAWRGKRDGRDGRDGRSGETGKDDRAQKSEVRDQRSEDPSEIVAAGEFHGAGR